MASVQLQQTVTQTETAISQQQSLEVVQTVLHSGDAYSARHYGGANGTIHSYKDYAAAKIPKHKESAMATKVQVLRRGKVRRADYFLDLLEKGAFKALKAGHLRSVQVHIFSGAEEREKALETYTFTISYASDGETGRTPSGVGIESSSSGPTTVQSTSIALQQLLRCLERRCRTLPQLPVERHIGVELFFTKDTEYNLKGFVANTSNRLLLAHAEGWDSCTKPIEKVDSKFHRSTLKVSSMWATASVGDPTSFPSAIDYPEAKSRERFIDEPTFSPANILVGASNLSASDLGRSAMADEIPDSAAVSQEQRVESTAYTLPNRTSTSHHALASDTAMGNALLYMMNPEQIAQGDTQSQGFPPPPPSCTETTMSPSRYSYTMSPAKSDFVSSVHGLQPQSVMKLNPKPTLSRAVASKLEAKKTELRKCARRGIKSTSHKAVTRCQCTEKEEDGVMVKCIYCGTWQHLACYGYENSSDLRLPDDHTCYTCLAGQDQSAMRKLQELVNKRRAIHLALEKGLTDQKQFAEDMEMRLVHAGPLFQSLRSDGYVVPSTDTKSKKLVPVKAGLAYEKMQKDLFDPMRYIAHHYVFTSMPDPTALSSRSSRNAMPPPMTPAARLHPQKKATPGSGLDPRQSQTPFFTPSKRSSCQPQQSKRPFDEDLPEMPSKRQATPEQFFLKYRSVQSEFLIDATTPSSPYEVPSSPVC